MKKFLSLIMVCICIFSFAIPTFAASDTPDTSIGDGVNIDDTIGFDSEVIQPASELSTAGINSASAFAYDPEEWGNRAVARVYLCATANSLTGHIWLYFVNLTPYELPLGYVTLLPGEEMSVGSLRNTRKDGGGTYYNGEAYMCKDLDKCAKNTTSLSMEISYDQLVTIGNKIKSLNSYLILGNNCGDFACKCWNTIAPKNKQIKNLLVPAPTIAAMKAKGGVKGQVKMKKPFITRCFKQVDGGVRQANAASFNASCVNW